MITCQLVQVLSANAYPAPPCGALSRRIVLPQELPEWKALAFKRLEELKALPHNWDGYGSAAPAADLVSKMALLVQGLPDAGPPRTLPMPQISPAADGLQIEWNGGKRGVEIILSADGTDVFVAEVDGEFEDGPINPGDSFAVSGLLQRVFGSDYRAVGAASFNQGRLTNL